jgi:hypothetical protein
MRTVSVTSLAFRVILYFAVNPDEELLVTDIGKKYDEDPRQVRWKLRNAVAAQVLVRESVGPGRGKSSTYRAGPLLLRTLGIDRSAVAVALEACASLSQHLTQVKVRITA